MKTASQLVEEMALYVRPPRGIAIVLRELPDENPNWMAAAGVMEATKAREFSAKVAKLRKSDPVVDWSGVTEMETGRRRVAQRLSEVVAAK